MDEDPKEFTVEEATDILIKCGELREAIDRLCKKAENIIRRSQIRIVKHGSFSNND